MKKVFYIPLCLLLLSAAVHAQEKITLDNYYTMPAVSSGVISPKGDKVAYTISSADPKQNSSNSDLIIQDISSGKKEVVASKAGDPQWSPDGSKLAFRTSVNNKSGIYYLTADNHTPVLVAEVFGSNHFLGHAAQKNYAWSPDGKSIAFVGADPNTGDANHDKNEPRIVERILYKSRTTFSDNRLTKIYLADLAGGPARILTNDQYDSHSISWAPDSKQIAYISNHTTDADANYNNDVFVVDIQGNQKQLTKTPGTEHNPKWSPDGKYILFPATIRMRNTKDSPPEDTKLYIYEIATGKTTGITNDLDERVDGGEWAGDSKSFYFGFPRKGKRVIYKGNIQTGKFSPVIDKEASAGRFTLSGQKLVFSMSDVSSPNELYYTADEGKNLKKLTSDASDWLKNKEISKTEAFWFKTFDGVDVQGFISYPTNLKAGDKIPVIHRIHGGPHGAFGYSFTDIAEIMVAKGYAVISINPRGSTGYGQRFSDGTYQAWGGGDYQDLMLGIDYALVKYPFLNEAKMGVTGGSYGGFMTNWVITQTNRYKAAVTSASVSNLISFYGTSLYQDLIETEFNGYPWDNYALLWHFSPMAHIKNVKTPTLLIHGENDIDVPITQAEEFYIGLKKLGVPARFVRYPNEGHGFQQPKNRLHNSTQTLAWFDQYLK